jgi:pimeloyl-ACP methyl ester carboxylesterase
MPTLTLDDIEIFYECPGAGPPLMLIHGLGSSGDDSAFQRDDFARAGTLILPDLRGSGRSAKPPGPYSIARFAADLWGLLDALAIDAVDLLGFSLGGAVAIEMALLRPTANTSADRVQHAGQLSHRHLAQVARGARAAGLRAPARTAPHGAAGRKAHVSAR